MTASRSGMSGEGAVHDDDDDDDDDDDERNREISLVEGAAKK